jgi:tRNA 2-thiouridine synthesizing protein E
MAGEILVGGRRLAVDEEGYLLDFTQWDYGVAAAIAELTGTTLGEGHWEVLLFLREYYSEFGIAPAIRVLTKALGRKFGPEKGNSKYLYDLFPGGPAKQACRIAGLPKPTGCI